jgi:biofilm PGA synthesis protein PgaA
MPTPPSICRCARAQGIIGDRSAFAMRWQPRAQHALRASYAQVDYSDGNRGETFGLASWHRLPLGRRFTLVLEPGLYRGSQRLQDVPYFSPRRDLSLELGATLERRLWSRSGGRVGHALEFLAGQYRQSGYGAQATARIGWRIDWDFATGSHAFLRLARGRRAYDGAPEYQTLLEIGGWWSPAWSR